MVRAMGVKNVKVVNPNKLSEMKEAMDEALALDEPSVIITRWPCILKTPRKIWTSSRVCAPTNTKWMKRYVSVAACV